MKHVCKKKGLTLLSLLMMVLFIATGAVNPALTAKAADAAVPSVSAQTVGPYTIKVSWTGVKNAEGYRIYVKDGETWKQQGDYKSTTRWVNVWGLKPDTQYTFTVAALTKNGSDPIPGDYDRIGASAVTAPAESKPTETKPAESESEKPQTPETPQKPAETDTDMKPSAPSVKAQSVDWNTIKVSWTGVKNADGYRIYIKDGKKWVKQGDYKSTTRWVRIGNLNFNQKYTFTVRAYKKTDSGKVWGSYDKTGVSAVPAINEPKLNQVNWTGKGLMVSWTAVNGADGYRIYRKDSTPGAKWKKIAQITGQNRTNYIDETAVKTDTFSYTVKAFRNAGNKAVFGTCDQKGVTWTGTSEKPAAVTKPAAPTVKAQAVSQNSIKVSWIGVKGAEGYRIYIKNGSNWVKQGDYKSTTRWVKINGLKADTKYTFTVRAWTSSDSGKVWGSYDKTGVSAVTLK